MTIDRAQCEALDRDDPLRHCRGRFTLPDGVLYLDGNSLGALPRGVAERVGATVAEEWGRGLIRSWNSAGWYASPQRAGAKTARLIGAAAHEVTVTDAISINLFKLLVAARRMRPDRKVIVAEAGNFPSDLYVVDSVARLVGCSVRRVRAGEVAAAVDGDTAVATLSEVNFKSAERQDMAAVTAAAHAQGALILWDLAHSSGAVDVQLNRAGADFAIGCGYKFLNGGPGAPGHLFVAERHLAAVDQPLTGWFGHAEPFAFSEEFARAEGIRRMLCSTPPMLSMAAYEAALDAYDGVTMDAVEAKARAMGDLLIALFDQRLAPLGCRLESPRDGTRRGSHVSIGHDQGYAVMQALIARGVIGDFRAPDVMRFGLTPLYLGYADVFDAVAAVEDVITSKAFEAPEFQRRHAVT
ncbi:kynureninase [Inquilinus limosus]|uniref:Kynureninase n=1 Tax=Inquilinus limosus TaxID=171674 RepID=A0A211ZMN1_9PROT|nr:kynureninase [Inquilinus limosus]OWJ66521.1 kynureninase [Inquilinus limosus]